MTKRDYFNVAYALRNSKPDMRDSATDAWYWADKQWQNTVDYFVGTFRTYANFKADLFRAACGYSVKPDGSMWTVDWSRNIVPNFRSV